VFVGSKKDILLIQSLLLRGCNFDLQLGTAKEQSKRERNSEGTVKKRIVTTPLFGVIFSTKTLKISKQQVSPPENLVS